MFTDKPWDGSRDRFTDSEWEWSCLVHDYENGVHSVPIREPDGTININAVREAYVSQDVSDQVKQELEHYLVDYYNQGKNFESPLYNSVAGSQCDTVNYEDEFIIERPVVLMKEGVFTGTDGRPRKKTYEVFKNSAHWLNGIPITRGHIPADEEVMPYSPRIGQVRAAKPRDDTRDVFGIARFFKPKLTPEEYADIKSGKKIDGSIGYRCGIEKMIDSAVFEGQTYIESEIGEYAFYHYAIVNEGACSSSDGCGVNQNQKGDIMVDGEGAAQTAVKDMQIKVELDDAKVSALLDSAKETEKQLNAAIDTLKASVAELTEKVGTTEKSLNEALETIKTISEEREQKLANEKAAKAAEVDAKALEGFKMHLNEAAREKAPEYFEEYKKVGEAWFVDNADKHMNAAPSGDIKGSQKVVIDNYNASVIEAQQALAAVGTRK